MFATKKKGVRYLEMAEGYVLNIGLDKNGEVIGYKFVHLGKMMEQIRKGVAPAEAYESNIKTYGRYDEAVKDVYKRQQKSRSSSFFRYCFTGYTLVYRNDIGEYSVWAN